MTRPVEPTGDDVDDLVAVAAGLDAAASVAPKPTEAAPEQDKAGPDGVEVVVDHCGLCPLMGQHCGVATPWESPPPGLCPLRASDVVVRLADAVRGSHK